MTQVLTVCTGNICRSPVAELLLADLVGDIARVSSAGVSAMVDHGIPAELLMSLDGAGIDGRAHRARQITPSLATEQDLIIAMTAEHRSAVVRETPGTVRRVFLLDELAQAARHGAPLDGATAAERLAGIPEAIAAFRPELAGLDVRDVPDPYRRSQAAYDDAFAMIDKDVRDIVAWVRG